MKKWFESLLSSKAGSVSSKRVCGIIGWIFSLCIAGYCTYTQKESPIITEYIIVASCALLGIDSISRTFNKK